MVICSLAKSTIIISPCWGKKSFISFLMPCKVRYSWSRLCPPDFPKWQTKKKPGRQPCTMFFPLIYPAFFFDFLKLFYPPIRLLAVCFLLPILLLLAATRSFALDIACIVELCVENHFIVCWYNQVLSVNSVMPGNLYSWETVCCSRMKC